MLRPDRRIPPGALLLLIMAQCFRTRIWHSFVFRAISYLDTHLMRHALIRRALGTAIKVSRGASALGKCGSTARLDRLDLVKAERRAVEAGGELVSVEEDALGRGNWTKVGTGLAADASVGCRDGLAQWTELLSVIAVRAKRSVRRRERGRQGMVRRGGMRLGRVVDGSCQDSVSKAPKVNTFF